LGEGTKIYLLKLLTWGGPQIISEPKTADYDDDDDDLVLTVTFLKKNQYY